MGDYTVLLLRRLDLHFFFSSRRRQTRCSRDWSSDVCSSDLGKPRLHPRSSRWSAWTVPRKSPQWVELTGTIPSLSSGKTCPYGRSQNGNSSVGRKLP